MPLRFPQTSHVVSPDGEARPAAWVKHRSQSTRQRAPSEVCAPVLRRSSEVDRPPRVTLVWEREPAPRPRRFVGGEDHIQHLAPIVPVTCGSVSSARAGAVIIFETGGSLAPVGVVLILAPQGIREGKALASVCGFIDTSGEFVVPPIYRAAAEFYEGRAAVSGDAGGGYVSRDGREVIPREFGYTYAFSEGLAVVSDDPNQIATPPCQVRTMRE